MAPRSTEGTNNQVRVQESIQYSFIANHRETMLALAQAKFSDQEFRVIIALLNQTNGYLRGEDEISSTFWQALTLLSRQSVHATLQGLAALTVVATDGRTYRVTHPNEWAPEIFQPQRLARKAVDTLDALHQREKEKKHYRWLARTLRGLRAMVLHSAASQQTRKASPTSDGKASPTSDGKASPTSDGKASPTSDAPSPTRDAPSPTSDGLGGTIGGAKESSKESSKDNTTPSVEGVASRTQRKSPDPRVKDILEAMKGEFGFPAKSKIDPIPNYGKEGQAIKRMLTRGFTPEAILAAWRGKVSIRGEFVSMHWVNEDIGKEEGAGRPRGTSRNGSPPHRRTKHPPFRPRGEG